MWNVVGPFEVGSLADLVVVSEVVQSQSRCPFLAEQRSEVQIAATVADSAAAEGEDRMVGGVEVSAEGGVGVASVADAMTLGVVVVVAATAVADSGVYSILHRLKPD